MVRDLTFAFPYSSLHIQVAGFLIEIKTNFLVMCHQIFYNSNNHYIKLQKEDQNQRYFRTRPAAPGVTTSLSAVERFIAHSRSLIRHLSASV